MKFNLNGTDITSLVSSASLDLGQTESVMELVIKSPNVLIGQEIVAYEDDDTIICGGIVYSTEKEYSGVGVVINNVAVGSYVIRLQHRNIAINVAYSKVNEIIQNNLTGILNQEGITIGSLSEDVIDSDTITYDCISVADLLDDLAKATRNIWWITKDKILNMLPDMTINISDKVVTDDNTNTNRVLFVTLPRVIDNIQDYCNKLFVVGEQLAEEFNVGSYTDTANVNIMKDRYGNSGVYGKVDSVPLAQLKTVLDEIAKASYERLDKSHRILFSTKELLNVNDVLLVDLELCDINAYYIVEKVEIDNVLSNIRKITMRLYSEGKNKPRKTPREDLNALLKNTSDLRKKLPTESLIRSKYTTNSGDYMITPATPYYISSVKASFIRDNVQCRVFVKVRGNNVSATKLKADLYIMQDYGDTTSEPVLVLSGWKPAATGPFNEVWFCDVDVNRGDYAFVVEVSVDSGQFDIPPKGAEIRFESIYLTNASSVPIPPVPEGDDFISFSTLEQLNDKLTQLFSTNNTTSFNGLNYIDDTVSQTFTQSNSVTFNNLTEVID